MKLNTPLSSSSISSLCRPYLRYIILSLFFLLSFNPAISAQNIDSLLTVWEDKSQSDSLRANAYQIYLWDGLLFSNPDSAAVLSDNLIEFGKKQSYPPAIANALRIKGISNAIQSDYTQALSYFNQSLKVYREINYERGIVAVTGNIGIIYHEQGDYPKAIDFYKQSLSIYEKQNNLGGVSSTLNNIGLIYKTQGDFTKSLSYFEKSLKIFEQLEDISGIAVALGNIGIIYNEQKNYPKALELYTKSLKILEQIEDEQGIARTMNNIGHLFKKQDEVNQALSYYERSLTIYEELGDQNGIANAQISFGTIYTDLGNYKQAIKFCKSALSQAENIDALEKQKEACQCLYDSYKNLGDSKSALLFLEKINNINDSLKKEETNKKLQQMEFQKVVLQDSIAKAEESRLVKEAHQEELQQKKQTQNLLIIFGVLLLLLALGFYSRWRYVRKAKGVIAKERDRSETLLLNILPADVAEELKQNGKAEARDFDMVSILFTDFKSFTEQSAKLSPTELVNEINVCFEAFDAIIDKYGVEKIKTIGDAYMAAGGLPVSSEDSVKNTVLASLEMQDFIINRKAKFETYNSSPSERSRGARFEMRVGIHTGPVVAGIVGVKKFQYDIWGDTVNTASRMESAGEVGKVNISQTTYELLKDDSDFTFESRGKIKAKGKGEIEMLFVSLA